MPALPPHDVPRSTRDERLEEIRRLFDRYRRLARAPDRRREDGAEPAAARARTAERMDHLQVRP